MYVRSFIGTQVDVPMYFSASSVKIIKKRNKFEKKQKKSAIIFTTFFKYYMRHFS